MGLEHHRPSPQVFDAQQGVGDEILEQGFLLECVNQIEGVLLFALLVIDDDCRRMIQRLAQHVAVGLRVATFDVVFPNHFAFVESSPGDEEPVAVHEILGDELMDEVEIAEVLTHVEDIVPSVARMGVESITDMRIVEPLEIPVQFAFVGRLFDVVKQAHAQRVGIEAHTGHGRDPGVDPCKFDFMAPDAVVLKEERFVPVAGPPLVHDLGADLGLEEQGGLAHDFDDRLHPLVLFFIDEFGMRQDVLEQIVGSCGSGTFVFGQQGLEFRIAPVHFGKKDVLAKLADLCPALVVAFDLLDVFVGFDLLDVLKENIEVIVQSQRMSGRGNGEKIFQLLIVAHQVVDAAAEFDDIVDPSAVLGAQFCDDPFVRQGLSGKVVIPGVAKEYVVLEKVDVRQHMVKDHHIEPVGVVVVVIGDRRPRVDHGLIGVAGIEFIFALALEHLHVVNPVVIESGNHQFGRQLEQVPVGHHIFEGLVFKAQAGLPGARLASLHDVLGVLVDQFHVISPGACYFSWEIRWRMPSIRRDSSASSSRMSMRINSGDAVSRPDRFTYRSTSVALLELCRATVMPTRLA